MSLLYGPAVSIPSTSPSPSPSPSTPSSSFLSTFVASRTLSQTSSSSSLPSQNSSRTPSQSSFTARRTPSQSSSSTTNSRSNIPRFQASSLPAFQESQPATGATAREPETVSYRFNNETDVYILPCLSMGNKCRPQGQQVDMAGARRNEERKDKEKKKGWKHRAFWR